jgi:hypothetical protein
VERVKKLQKTPLCVKKFANSGLFDSFFALIGAFFILFSTVPELCKDLYYEKIKPNLGLEFAIEVQKSINQILTHPTAWSELGGEIRRCLVNRFPFGVLYSIFDNEIFIIAVMNLHRHPNYWNDRLK